MTPEQIKIINSNFNYCKKWINRHTANIGKIATVLTIFGINQYFAYKKIRGLEEKLQKKWDEQNANKPSTGAA